LKTDAGLEPAIQYQQKQQQQANKQTNKQASKQTNKQITDINTLVDFYE